MPRHTGAIVNRQSIANIIVNVFEIHDTDVIKVLTREQSLWKISRMDIRKRVSMRVPSSKTEIKTTNGSILVVYKNDLERGSMESQWISILGEIKAWVLCKPSRGETRIQHCLKNEDWASYSWISWTINTFCSDMVGMTHTSDVRVKMIHFCL